MSIANLHLMSDEEKEKAIAREKGEEVKKKEIKSSDNSTQDKQDKK